MLLDFALGILAAWDRRGRTRHPQTGLMAYTIGVGIARWTHGVWAREAGYIAPHKETIPIPTPTPIFFGEHGGGAMAKSRQKTFALFAGVLPGRLFKFPLPFSFGQEGLASHKVLAPTSGCVAATPRLRVWEAGPARRVGAHTLGDPRFGVRFNTKIPRRREGQNPRNTAFSQYRICRCSRAL